MKTKPAKENPADDNDATEPDYEFWRRVRILRWVGPELHDEDSSGRHPSAGSAGRRSWPPGVQMARALKSGGDVEELAGAIRRLLAAIDAGEITASAAYRARLEGALAGLEALLGSRR
jgi:hypothetical protein